MVEVTNELIYEVLKKVQEQLGHLEAGQRGIQEELRAIREHARHAARHQQHLRQPRTT